jgi:hypothetical protein
MPELIEEECDIPKRSKMFEYGNNNFSISDCVIFSELCIGNDDEMNQNEDEDGDEEYEYNEMNIINSDLVDVEDDDEVVDQEEEDGSRVINEGVDETYKDEGGENINELRKTNTNKTAVKQSKKDKIIKNIKVDPIDILMKDTRVTGEKLNQLNDWMDDL